MQLTKSAMMETIKASMAVIALTVFQGTGFAKDGFSHMYCRPSSVSRIVHTSPVV